MNSVNSKETPIINRARGMRKMSSEWYEAQENFMAESILRIVQTHNVSEATATSIFKRVSEY